MNLGILFTKCEICNSQPFKKKEMNVAYATLAKKAQALGINLYVSRYDAFSSGKLLVAWHYEKRWKRIFNVSIDLVYCRFNRAIYRNYCKDSIVEMLKYNMLRYVKLVNHPLLDEFCWDKVIIAKALRKDVPRTFLIQKKEDVIKALEKISSDRVVIKPRYGTLGSCVRIVTKKSMSRILGSIKKNTIIQEFIETKNGIAQIVNGRHDLRLIIINGRIDHAHVRVPAKGKLIANMALGGKKFFVPLNLIPKRVFKIARRIDSMLKYFNPRMYSIDFLFGENAKPYVVECNSTPSLRRYGCGKYIDSSFYERFLQGIVLNTIYKTSI